MDKASLKILALGAMVMGMVPAGAMAQAITLDTTGAQQVFGVSGTKVGTWTTSLFNVLTPVNITGATVVTGNITGTNLISNNAITAVTGNITNTLTADSVTAHAYYHNSDARLKTDIRPINGALDKVLALHGVEFNWKKDGRADMGVVAQNVAQVFPNVVAKNESGVMAVEYDSLVGPMIEAIRDLKAQNDDLRAQVKEIRASMQMMKQDKAHLNAVKYEMGTEPAATLNP